MRTRARQNGAGVEGWTARRRAKKKYSLQTRRRRRRRARYEGFSRVRSRRPARDARDAPRCILRRSPASALPRATRACGGVIGGGAGRARTSARGKRAREEEEKTARGRAAKTRARATTRVSTRRARLRRATARRRARASTISSIARAPEPLERVFQAVVLPRAPPRARRRRLRARDVAANIGRRRGADALRVVHLHSSRRRSRRRLSLESDAAAREGRVARTTTRARDAFASRGSCPRNARECRRPAASRAVRLRSPRGVQTRPCGTVRVVGARVIVTKKCSSVR